MIRKHTAQIRLYLVTAILDIWWTTEGPPSVGPAFLTLLYDHESIVPPIQDCWPIGGLGWRHKAPRIIESVSFREDPPAGPAQFNLCHFLTWQGPSEVLGSVPIWSLEQVSALRMNEEKTLVNLAKLKCPYENTVCSGPWSKTIWSEVQNHLVLSPESSGH